MEPMFYVYLLHSTKDNGFYIGYSTDLKKRLSQHTRGASFATKSRGPWKLIYYRAYTAVVLMSFVCPRISPKGSILVLSTRALPLNLVFKMSNQITPLHPVASGSRRTSAPRNDSSANSRFACKTISTASFKFARASSSVAPCVFAPGSSSTNAAYPSGNFRKTAVSLISMSIL